MAEGSVVQKQKPEVLSKSMHASKPTGQETTQRRRRKARSNSLLCAASDYKDVLRASARHYKESQENKKVTTGTETKVTKSRMLSRLRDPPSRSSGAPGRSVSDARLIDSLSQSLHADTARMEGKNRRASLSQSSFMGGSRRSLLDNSRMEGKNRRASLSQTSHIGGSRRSLVDSSHMWTSHRSVVGSFADSSFNAPSLGVMGQKHNLDEVAPSGESQSFLTHAVEIRRRKHFQKCSKSATLIQKVARGWLVRSRHGRIGESPKSSKSSSKNKSKNGRESEKRNCASTSRKTRPSLLARSVHSSLLSKTAPGLEASFVNEQSILPGDDLEADLCNMFRSNIADVTARARRRSSCYARVGGICA